MEAQQKMADLSLFVSAGQKTGPDLSNNLIFGGHITQMPHVNRQTVCCIEMAFKEFWGSLWKRKIPRYSLHLVRLPGMSERQQVPPAQKEEENKKTQMLQ